MTDKQEQHKAAETRRATLVTYWDDSYVKVIHPIEFKPLERNQEALRALVRYYASLADVS